MKVGKGCSQELSMICRESARVTSPQDNAVRPRSSCENLPAPISFFTGRWDTRAILPGGVLFFLPVYNGIPAFRCALARSVLAQDAIAHSNQLQNCVDLPQTT